VFDTDKRSDDNFKFRTDAIEKCHRAAKDTGMNIFALQDGGYCFGAMNTTGYDAYGNVSICANGKGGFLANDVYLIQSKPVRFDEWSSWSSCDVTCGDKATQQRTRGCWTNCSRPLKEIRRCVLASCPVPIEYEFTNLTKYMTYVFKPSILNDIGTSTFQAIVNKTTLQDEPDA
jgi:hypothetical protein